MHTTMVHEQVKTLKIQAGVQVSRPEEHKRHIQHWKRFGRHLKEEDHSEFRKRVFPNNANFKGEHLLELVKNDVEFNQLDDDDVVRVCLLLALDYVFMDIGSSKEVRTRVVDEEDVQERAILAKTVKEQKQMIAELQRHLYSVEQITKLLHTGPSDVDLLDKNGNHSHNVPVGGLDQQSMEGVSQCMNDDQVDKNCNDVSDNFLVDGPEYQSVKGVSQCTSVDHFDKRFKDEYDSIAVDGLISLKSQDVDHIFKKSFVMDDPKFKTKDNEEGSYSNSFLSTQQKYPGKACVSPYVPPPSIEVKYKKRRRVMKLDKPNILIRTRIGPDGNEIPWKEDLTRSPNAPKKKTISVHEGVMSLFRNKKRMDMQHPNDDWLMASPYLSDMLLWYGYPLYYADGVKYCVPWFAKSVKKVYFPVNESDSHWVLGELDITSGVITFYDSLGGPPGVPLQGGLYGDCGLWVCIFLYRLSHNIPLEVDDSSNVALAWRERIIDFY
ncbi:phospholipase-like protein [Tanacetum coccineum]